MDLKYFLATVSFILISISSKGSETHYVGGDISLLPIYEEACAKYRDPTGKPINDLLQYLYDEGMNAMRVRLFVDPESFAVEYPSDYDPNACQSLPFIIPLCKDIIGHGFELMLDFHYSNTWADPSAQWIPKVWEGLNDEELALTLYEYTKNTLVQLREEGIVPAFIQPGNEISYGMLWAPYKDEDDSNKTYLNGKEAAWERLGLLLESAIKACREECPEAKIILHTERTSDIPVLTNFYNKMKQLDIDYDIIGLSYYPYWHGKINILDNALTALEDTFPEKNIMIVETGYSYAWEIGNQPVDYPLTEAGQDEYAHELVDILLKHPNVDGLFWWWLEYNAYGTKLEGWYNAPLFNSQTGKATPALKTICSFRTGFNEIESLHLDMEYNSSRTYTIDGMQVEKPTGPGFYIEKGKIRKY